MTTKLRHLHINICVDNKNPWHDIEKILAVDPDIITFNEVRTPRIHAAVKRLRKHGYRVRFHRGSAKVNPIAWKRSIAGHFARSGRKRLANGIAGAYPDLWITWVVLKGKDGKIAVQNSHVLPGYGRRLERRPEWHRQVNANEIKTNELHAKYGFVIAGADLNHPAKLKRVGVATTTYAPVGDHAPKSWLLVLWTTGKTTVAGRRVTGLLSDHDAVYATHERRS